MPGNVETNVAAALAAVAVVRKNLRFHAGNRAEDREEIYRAVKRVAGGTYPGGPAVVEVGAKIASLLPEMLVVSMRVEDHLRHAPIGEVIWGPPIPMQGIPRIRDVANQARRYEAANCSDQACMAFIELYDHGIHPLDIMFLTNYRHAFVVIGKDKQGTEDPATWGEEAVICDAWNNDAYQLHPATVNSLLLSKMQCNCSTAKSQFRHD